MTGICILFQCSSVTFIFRTIFEFLSLWPANIRGMSVFQWLKNWKKNPTESDFTFSPFTLSILYSFAFPCWGFLGLLTKCKHEMKVFLQFQSKAICLKGEKVVSCWLSTNHDSQHSREEEGGSLQEWKARTVVLKIQVVSNGNKEHQWLKTIALLWIWLWVPHLHYLQGKWLLIFVDFKILEMKDTFLPHTANFSLWLLMLDKSSTMATVHY